MLITISILTAALVHDPRRERPPLDYTSQFKSAVQPISLAPIGFIESPFKERFGTPRQPTVTSFTAGGSTEQEGCVRITCDELLPEGLQDLEGFSHLWIISHLHLNTGFKKLVKPPRGPRDIRRGLLATRAPHRPSQIALSCVKITSVDAAAGRIGVLGLDLLDGTPVLDVKPYVPYADAFPDARAGWIDELDGQPDGPDDLEYWPPPAHLSKPDT